MDLSKVLSALLLLGSDLPAFKALWDQVIATFSEKDQATLKTAFDDAMAQADAAHKAAQSL